MGLSAHEAEDVVQDVFTIFLQKLDAFEGRSQLRTWLFGILHRKVMEHRRAASRYSRADPIDQVFEDRFDARGSWVRPPADLQRLLLSKEIHDVISLCMESLSPDQREAFVLREIEGLDTAEICKIMGLTITNFGVQMHRARAKLRECLERKGFSRKPAAFRKTCWKKGDDE